MKIYEQRQRAQEEQAKRKQVRSFDHLDAADFERRIDLETGEFLDGDDYVADASIQDNRPPVDRKAGNNSVHTNSAAPAPRREPHARIDRRNGAD